MNGQRKNWLPVLLLAGFVLTRWPGLMPPNFSAAYALVFCAGAFPRRLPGWQLLAVMLATDIGLNLCYYETSIFSDYQAINYLAYGLIFLLGRQFTHRASWLKLVGGGLLGAIVFYLVTNTAAWFENPEYAKTISGWVQALTVGTPHWPATWTFFRNTLLSGGLFTGLIVAALKSTEPAPAEAAEESETEEATETETEETQV